MPSRNNDGVILHTSCRKELPAVLSQPFSVTNIAEVLPATSRGMDDQEFRSILDRKVAAVRALVEGGLRTAKPSFKGVKGIGRYYSDNVPLLYLVSQERLKHVTRKALKTLRGRLQRLQVLRIAEKCGFWSEFVWLHQVIGVSM